MLNSFAEVFAQARRVYLTYRRSHPTRDKDLWWDANFATNHALRRPKKSPATAIMAYYAYPAYRSLLGPKDTNGLPNCVASPEARSLTANLWRSVNRHVDSRSYDGTEREDQHAGAIIRTHCLRPYCACFIMSQVTAPSQPRRLPGALDRYSATSSQPKAHRKPSSCCG